MLGAWSTQISSSHTHVYLHILITNSHPKTAKRISESIPDYKRYIENLIVFILYEYEIHVNFDFRVLYNYSYLLSPHSSCVHF